MGTARIIEWDMVKDKAVPGGVDFVVDFDPKSLALTHSPTGPVQGTATTSSGTFSQSTTQQTAVTSSLSLELTFDTSAEGTTVQARTDKLVHFTKPPPPPSPGTAPGRKSLRFSWGSFLYHGTVTSMSQTIDFFSEAGVPLRAQVHLTLEEVAPPDPAAADDGSGGFGGAIGIGASAGASASFGASAGASASFGASAGLSASASASAGAAAGLSAGAGAGVGFSAGASVGTTPLTLSASGDSIQVIAARAGTSWKEVAAANGIDNPRLLPPGTVVNAEARLEAF